MRMDSLHTRFSELLQGKKGKLLDAGAGEGILSNALSKMGFDVTSCDISPTDFKYGKCTKTDLNNDLPYKRNQFDCIVCAEVIEHIENPSHLIREFSRVLKKDGTLVISTPNIANVFSRIKFLLTGKFFCFSDEERRLGHLTPVAWWKMEEVLKTYGFSVEKISSNAHLMITGCSGFKNSGKRVIVRIAYLMLYPFIKPKNKEILKADSLIFLAKNCKQSLQKLQTKSARIRGKV